MYNLISDLDIHDKLIINYNKYKHYIKGRRKVLDTILRIDSISELHEIIGYGKPKHPLITLIDFDKVNPKEYYGNRSIVTGFYMISLKNGKDCEIKYGRRYYDFSEGSLIFIEPEQVSVFESKSKTYKNKGWMLCFHPDLIRKSPLRHRMGEFSFFSYDTNEALHLSDQEKATITQIVKTIEHEYSLNLDNYSHDLITSNLEVLLNYSRRFYSRQFITRTYVNKDVLSRFEQLLKEHLKDDILKLKGTPSVKSLAMELGYSPNYLSDLLKKETGKNTLEHINLNLVEKAKTMLLGSEKSVKEIAYTLGFEYPANFSKFFKAQTGMTPTKFRN